MASNINLMASCTILSIALAIDRGLVRGDPLAFSFIRLANFNFSLRRVEDRLSIFSLDIPSSVSFTPLVIFPGLLFIFS